MLNIEVPLRTETVFEVVWTRLSGVNSFTSLFFPKKQVLSIIRGSVSINHKFLKTHFNYQNYKVVFTIVSKAQHRFDYCLVKSCLVKHKVGYDQHISPSMCAENVLSISFLVLKLICYLWDGFCGWSLQARRYC